jgi:hypothetical protein
MRLIDADAVLNKIHVHMKITEQQATEEIRDDEVQYMLMLHLAEKFIKTIPSAEVKQGWIPCSEMLPADGSWNIFTDGKRISVERYKRDAIDHFFPDGRWFELEDAVAWMPLPKAYKGEEG